MPACERLGDRAGVHPCTVHRPLPADQGARSCWLFMQYLLELDCADLQAVPWYRMEGTLVPLFSDTRH